MVTRFPDPPPHQAVTLTNRPESDTRPATPHRSHGQRARPPCTPPTPDSTPSLGASMDPALRVLFSPSRLTGLRPGEKLQRHQEQAEAGPRLAQGPATPHSHGTHTQGGGPAWAAAGRADSTGSGHSRGGRLHSGSTGDCPRPRPGLALRSSSGPGGARGKGGGG